MNVRRWVRLTLSFILVAVFAAHTFAADLTDGVAEKKLSNGLRVIVKEEKSFPVVGFSISYDVGFRNDDTDYPGVSHLLEHMLFQSTEKYKKGEIARLLNDLGAQFNAYTTYDRTVYWELFAPASFRTICELEAERMRNAKLDAGELATEQKVVNNELAGYENNPGTRLFRRFYGELFGNHPMAWIYGRPGGMPEISVDQISNFYRRYYRPDNACIVVVGNLSAKAVLADIEATFGKIRAEGNFEPDRIPLLPKTRGIHIEEKGPASESFGYQLFSLPPWNIDNPDCVVLGLIEQLGLIPGFSYDPNIDGSLGFCYYNSTPVVPAELLDRDYVLERVEVLKARFFARQALSYDSVASQMMTLAYFESRGSYRNYQLLMEKYRTVTAQDVLRVIRKYFIRPNANTATFIATKRDEGFQSESSSVHAESFGSRVDYADLDQPTPAAVKAARAKFDSLYARSKKSVEEYLSDIRETTFSNGCRLLYKPMSVNDKVVIAVGFNAGDMYQTSPRLASWVFDLIFEGGPQVQISRELRRRGASSSGGAMEEQAVISISCASADLPLAVSYLEKALVNRTFIPLALEEYRRRAVRYQETIQNDTDPDFRIDQEMKKRLFGRQGRGLDPYADKKMLGQISMEMVRQFYETYYRPERMTISVAGAVKFEEVKRLISGSLGAWEMADTHTPGELQRLVPPQKEEFSRIRLPIQQDSVLMASMISSYTNNRNYLASMLACQIFGGDPLSSRLSRVVRGKEGLTYHISTFLDPYGPDTVLFMRFMSAPEEVDHVVALFKQEWTRFCEEGPNDLEVERIKTSYLGGLMFSYENAESVARTLLMMKMRRGRADYDRVIIENLRTMDRQAIVEVLHSDWKNPWTGVIAGKE